LAFKLLKISSDVTEVLDNINDLSLGAVELVLQFLNGQSCLLLRLILSILMEFETRLLSFLNAVESGLGNFFNSVVFSFLFGVELFLGFCVDFLSNSKFGYVVGHLGSCRVLLLF
jgi:hypothetical protein